MAFALLFIGIVLVVACIRNTQGGPGASTPNLVSLVQGDFTGPGNFGYWIVAIIAVGAVGYIDKAKPVSDGLLVLIILALVLSKGNPSQPGGGFFTQFVSAVNQTTAPAQSSGTASSVGSTLGGILSGIGL